MVVKMSTELMPLQSKRHVILNKKQKIVQSGRSSHLPLSKELKALIGIGDEIQVIYYIENGKLFIQGIKELCKFTLDEIKTLGKQNNFKITDDKNIGTVKVFQAIKDSTTISCIQNLDSHKVSITISKTEPVIDYFQYKKLTQKILKSNPDAIIQPAGDLDVINILEDPSQYNLDFKKAFSLLKKNNKKIGISVLFRFDNENHTLKNIKQILDKTSLK